ncbi:putative palmitoyltransferase zdhhc24 [Clonorchis sinensis]|uniref:Palmitoyltransferase n=1 Tax=Clonorchis sinensis TaxID=79923 RepID=A0A419QDV0_CLOSI|nr:putative palmitoyltransferase zdhhc24 [Clonorchis sinensis]
MVIQLDWRLLNMLGLSRQEEPRPFVEAKTIDDSHRKNLASQRWLRFPLLVYVIFLLYMELSVILPALYAEHWTAGAIVVIFGVWILVCFTVSAVRIVLTDPTIKGVMLVSRARRDWTYCISCQTFRPPRTHHCYVCDTCVIRRDHHCVFLAQCIGLANWRFFLSLLFYGALGTSVASYLNFRFLLGDYFLPTDWSAIYRAFCILAPPGLLWTIGLATLFQTAVFLLTSSCSLLACLLFGSFFYCINLMLHNQTMSDRTARSKALAVDPDQRTAETQAALVNTTPDLYDIGPRENVKQFLGIYWPLALFFPFFNSPLTVDGLSFPRSDQTKFR